MENNFEIIVKICERAEEIGITSKRVRMTHILDIEYATSEFNIDLESWLNADCLNFAHDFYGIYNNINRETKSFGYFVPRYANMHKLNGKEVM